jgi:hypothetical protein
MMFVLVLATGAACSSGSESERADETAATQEMAQTEAEATEQDSGEQAEADKDLAEAEEAEGEEAEGDRAGMKHCPMADEDTEVAAENTENGVAMVFTTTGDVDELRERVQWMAQHHGKMKDHGKMKGHGKKKGHAKMEGKKKGHAKMEGKKKGHAKHGMMAKSMPQATVTAEEVDQGMKLVFSSDDEKAVEKLQKHIGQHVEQVKAGGCPMKYDKSEDAADAKKS